MAEQEQITLVDHSSSSPSPNDAETQQSNESEFDVLYENQRGFFFLGVPFYSHNALLGSFLRDQGPWVTAQFKPSPVDITNAQVPDPSWEWDWRTWYVDMSHDVDEEGWQYSLMFRKGCAWHGTHPWLHSFVRRRRWLRKRVKRKHAITSKEEPRGTSIGTSVLPSTFARDSQKVTVEEEPVEMQNIGSLKRFLKKAAIDREKIAAINTFIEDGGEELHYLAEEMPSIMSMLMFQGSRRELLANLTSTFDAASKHRDQHRERGEPEDEVEERKINNLLKAVEAADEQVKKLEYWSDVKGITQDCNTTKASGINHGWDHGWRDTGS